MPIHCTHCGADYQVAALAEHIADKHPYCADCRTLACSSDEGRTRFHIAYLRIHGEGIQRHQEVS